MRKLISFLLIFPLLSVPLYAGLDCDGVDDYARSAGARIFTAASARTISLWANVDNPQPSSFRGRIISERNNFGWFFATGTSNDIQFFHSGSTSLNRVSNTSAFTADVWNHFLVTWDGGTTATNVHIYVNGSEVSYATTTNGVSFTSADGTSTLCIEGATSVTNPNNRIDGTLSELAVWDAVLDANEIALLASSRVKRIPLQIKPSNLKRYWPLDDVAGGSSADLVNMTDMSANRVAITANNNANDTGTTSISESQLSYP